MDRDDMLQRIDALYRARQNADLEEVARLVAADASFELAGEKNLVEAFAASGPLPVADAAAWLHANIAMHSVRRIEAVIEGNRAAVLSEATLSFGGREPAATLLYDLIEFAPDGQITRFRQFADTAWIMTEMQALGGEGPVEIVQIPASR